MEVDVEKVEKSYAITIRGGHVSYLSGMILDVGVNR